MNANETGLRDVTNAELQTVDGGGVWNHEEQVTQTEPIGKYSGGLEPQPAIRFKV